jgi:hypothetical protein
VISRNLRALRWIIEVLLRSHIDDYIIGVNLSSPQKIANYVFCCLLSFKVFDNSEFLFANAKYAEEISNFLWFTNDKFSLISDLLLTGFFQNGFNESNKLMYTMFRNEFLKLMSSLHFSKREKDMDILAEIFYYGLNFMNCQKENYLYGFIEFIYQARQCIYVISTKKKYFYYHLIIGESITIIQSHQSSLNIQTNSSLRNTLSTNNNVKDESIYILDSVVINVLKFLEFPYHYQRVRANKVLECEFRQLVIEKDIRLLLKKEIYAHELLLCGLFEKRASTEMPNRNEKLKLVERFAIMDALVSIFYRCSEEDKYAITCQDNNHQVDLVDMFIQVKVFTGVLQNNSFNFVVLCRLLDYFQYHLIGLKVQKIDILVNNIRSKTFSLVVSYIYGSKNCQSFSYNLEGRKIIKTIWKETMRGYILWGCNILSKWSKSVQICTANHEIKSYQFFITERTYSSWMLQFHKLINNRSFGLRYSNKSFAFYGDKLPIINYDLVYEILSRVFIWTLIIVNGFMLFGEFWFIY